MKPHYWDEAKAHLARRDRVLRRIIRAHPDANLRTRGDAFRTLARSIVGQQISVKAAQAVWDRFEALAGRVAPAQVVALEDEAMTFSPFNRQRTEIQALLCLSDT